MKRLLLLALLLVLNIACVNLRAPDNITIGDRDRGNDRSERRDRDRDDDREDDYDYDDDRDD